MAAWPLVETCTPNDLGKVLLKAKNRGVDLVLLDTPAAANGILSIRPDP